jgi:AcrR family transcriptional regulator
VSNLNSGRRRRADAERSSEAVLAAAIDLLARRPQARMEEIAAAAGVARQTVYAHYSSRDRLLAAVVAHLTAEVAAAFDDLDLQSGSAADALGRWVDAAWQVVARYPVLLTDAVADLPGDEDERHRPISERLTEILERGRSAGELDDGPPVGWLVSAIIGLGHTAGQEAAAGRMSLSAAGAAYRRGVLRLCARD